MDYFQSIVADWLVSDGQTLLTEEYYLRTSHVKELKHRDQTYLLPDIIAVRLRDKKAFLCEVTWSRNWSKIKKKLDIYAKCMPEIREALEYWLGISQAFKVEIWYFVPEDNIDKINDRKPLGLPLVVTPLQEVLPWKYIHGQRTA